MNLVLAHAYLAGVSSKHCTPAVEEHLEGMWKLARATYQTLVSAMGKASVEAAEPLSSANGRRYYARARVGSVQVCTTRSTLHGFRSVVYGADQQPWAMQVAVGDVVACVPPAGEDVAWFGIIVRIFGPDTAKPKGKGGSDLHKYDGTGWLSLLCLFPNVMVCLLKRPLVLFFF
jgi:hypothetical protein